MLRLIKNKIHMRKTRKKMEWCNCFDCDIILWRLSNKILKTYCYHEVDGYDYPRFYQPDIVYHHNKPYYEINRDNRNGPIYEKRFRHPYFISYLYLKY